MKRIALLAVIGAGLMALPSTATAQLGTTNCPGGIGVSTGQICVHVNGVGGELVINLAGCSYINGWRDNPALGQGYAGICTGTPSRGPSCSTSGNGGANTGGCFEIKDAPAAVNQALNTFPVGLVTASFICGNTLGEDPRNTSRDGCSIPGDWLDR